MTSFVTQSDLSATKSQVSVELLVSPFAEYCIAGLIKNRRGAVEVLVFETHELGMRR